MNAFTAIDTASGTAAAPALHAEPVAQFVRLDAATAVFAAEWDDLAAHAAEPNAFVERWFLTASAPLADTSVRLLAIRDRGTLIGLLPLARASHYGRLPIAHVENWLHYHAFLGGPLLRRGHEQAAWTAILATLDADPASTGLLHLTNLVEHGPVHTALLATANRPCDTVHRIERAMLASDLDPDAYYAATVRKKKRKEIGRLQSRLAEVGSVTTRRFPETGELDEWIDTFLHLEKSGWKGRAGSALACQPETAQFFRDALHGAHAAGKLEMLRLQVDDRTIGILVNFLAAPGSFSFKTAFDEDFARYSPGVLIQLANLGILARRDIAWMDSCAAENHPMINSLWGERRSIVRVTLPLAGWRSRALFHAARTAERAAAALKRSPAPEPEA
jgi:CelD/BcsL family acetyltransferase involved in cellulose biosynthesis